MRSLGEISSHQGHKHQQGHQGILYSGIISFISHIVLTREQERRRVGTRGKPLSRLSTRREGGQNFPFNSLSTKHQKLKSMMLVNGNCNFKISNLRFGMRACGEVATKFRSLISRGILNQINLPFLMISSKLSRFRYLPTFSFFIQSFVLVCFREIISTLLKHFMSKASSFLSIFLLDIHVSHP